MQPACAAGTTRQPSQLCRKTTPTKWMNWPTKLPRIGLRLLRFGERRPRLGSPTARRVPPAARQDLTVKKEQRRINYCRLTFRVQLHGPLTDRERSTQAPVPDATTAHNGEAWPCQLQRHVRRQRSMMARAYPRGLLNEASSDMQRCRLSAPLAPPALHGNRRSFAARRPSRNARTGRRSRRGTAYG